MPNAPTISTETDYCIIGGGSGGLSAAAALASFGEDVTLIEGHKMGGDCLNYGCVPSKALLAAGKKASQFRTAAKFGIKNQEPEIDFAKVKDYVAEVIKTISHHDSVERFTELGVKVILGKAKFLSPQSIEVNGQVIKSKFFIISTGSSAAAPPIPGLSDIPYLTNESIFSLKDKPQHLVIIGAGPIGLEMAQAHHNLGVKVTVLEAFSPFAKDDPDLAKIVLNHLAETGLKIKSSIKISSIKKTEKNYTIEIEENNNLATITASHLLVAAGRKPNISNLDLDKANIKFSAKGIEVNAFLQTTQKNIFAIGDVIGGMQFTHMANAHATNVVTHLLFRFKKKINYNNIPWVTYTQPEIGWIGKSEQYCTENNIRYKAYLFDYKDNDRAQAEGMPLGGIKLLFDSKSRFIGGGCAGYNAGEIMNILSLCISKKLNVKDMISYISPYPTLTEIVKRAAVKHYKDFPKSKLVKLLKSVLKVKAN